jgi:hypothetical protein
MIAPCRAVQETSARYPQSAGSKVQSYRNLNKVKKLGTAPAWQRYCKRQTNRKEVRKKARRQGRRQRRRSKSGGELELCFNEI